MAQKSQVTGNGASVESATLDTNTVQEVADAVAPDAPEVPKKKYFATVCPGTDRPIDPDFAVAVLRLEEILQMPVWVIVQQGGLGFNSLNNEIIDDIFLSKNDLTAGEHVAVLIDSPGGQSKCAYQVASFLRQHCGGFTAVIPRYAKSAATLLTLGADNILLGKFAELGPLDVQIYDHEREEQGSALDEVQALERLHAFAIDAVDRSMFLLKGRSRKKVSTLMPMTLEFITGMMRPMLEKIDTVHYTQMSRALKVAEAYAVRLLQPQYSEPDAKTIARHLVENYPEHGFVIDAQEAATIGLRTVAPTAEHEEAFDAIIPHLDDAPVIGRIKEVDV